MITMNSICTDHKDNVISIRKSFNFLTWPALEDFHEILRLLNNLVQGENTI